MVAKRTKKKEERLDLEGTTDDTDVVKQEGENEETGEEVGKKIGEKNGVGIWVAKDNPHQTFTDGEPGDYTCYMCGAEHIEAVGGLTRHEGMALCSGACSRAHDECQYLPPAERDAFIRAYRADPQEKERRQKEIDEERRLSDLARAKGFGPRMR